MLQVADSPARMLTLADVRAARERIRGRVVLTPCTPSEAFGEMFGGRAWFKFENLQRTGSFKERGALNTMLSLPDEQRRRGVIAASAGNHAQGVAFHAARLGIPATIVMPERTPLIKVSNTERYGARVVLHGSIYDEAMAEALRIQAAEGQALVHPFDLEPVIAGQGTIGLELLEQCPDMEVVVVPVGGGGLISGVALAVRSARPNARIVAVEPEGSAALHAALYAGRPVRIVPRSVADGLNAPYAGERCLAVCREHVTDSLIVTEDEIAAGFRFLYERAKLAAEPAGAAGVGALLAGKVPEIEGKTAVVVVSGGNVAAETTSAILVEDEGRDPS